ncbi:hypothetical protein EZL74_02115 [Flavobacterium silvisoli]|uniref:Uncharacterized protein n=1 Tax=Flavobacterium silvisoli TaxID=2529433 RepID=A0A4Q9Z4E7_9FLAO|nr:hypothetical protein [Flavobacterium silvisoli]TBX71323.1 hypothetical protein EZL74_02115 [Flavobacterium silvisoli]
METQTKVSAVLRKIPYDIIAFFFFAVAVSVFSFYLNLDINKKLKASLIPYTGWGFGRGYMFFLFFIPICLLSFKGTVVKTLGILRIFIIISVLMQLFDGVQDWLQVAPEDYTNPNPYLRYDKLTPIYTIGVPLFWLVLMLIMLVISYLQFKNEKRLN